MSYNSIRNLIFHKLERTISCMKKSQLYHLIHSLIQKSKQEKQAEKEQGRGLVNSYYHAFLRKHKLVTTGKQQKIKDIMKSFRELDSYVDLNDIVVAIQQQIHQQNSKEIKQQLLETKNTLKRKSSKRLKTEPVETRNKWDILKKAQTLIRESYKQGKYVQLNGCAQVLQTLQSGSNQLNNIKYKNCPSSATFHELINRRYTEGKAYFYEHPGYSSGSCPNQQAQIQASSQQPYDEDNPVSSPWKILEERQKKYKKMEKLDYGTNNDDQMGVQLFELTEVKNNAEPIEKMPRQKKYFDTSKMLHSAAVYLHSILEREHQKKWIMNKSSVNSYNKTHLMKEQTTADNERVRQEDKTSTSSEQNFNMSQFKDQVKHSIAFKNKSSANPVENIPKRVNSKFYYRKSFKNAKMKSNVNINDISVKTEADCHRAKTRESKRVSISNEKQNFPQGSRLANMTTAKKPRHTMPASQHMHLLNIVNKKTQRGCLEEKKGINDKFTFKKRRVKEGVLRKITQFVNDVENAERNMIIESKLYEKQLERIQNKMDFQFQPYQTQKFMSDEKELEGVRSALSKQSTGMKRYQR